MCERAGVHSERYDEDGQSVAVELPEAGLEPACVTMDSRRLYQLSYSGVVS